MNIYGRLKRLLRWTRFSETTVREAIEELIEENNDDLDGASSIDEDEKEMLGNVLNLRDTQVRDIMVQRVEIKALSTTAKIDELVFAFVENQISSIIVYQGTLDNVIGVVYL
jgi:CBS domain containing-hemolysin-like protein